MLRPLRVTLIRLVGLTPDETLAGLRWGGFLLELTPYGAKGFAFAGWLAGEDAAVCLIFKSLSIRFLEGDIGAAPLPIVKADCKLVGCLAGAAVPEACWEPASVEKDSMREPGLMFAFPVKGL